MLTKRRGKSIKQNAVNSDEIMSIISMIDYLISEARVIDPMAEYFLRLARISFLEREQKFARRQRRH